MSQITDPRWRLDALARIVPELRRIGAPIDWARARVRRGAASARCPAPLRDRMLVVLVDGFERGSGDALAAMVEALWSRDWLGATFKGIGAALALGDREGARHLALYHWVVDSPVQHYRPRFDDFVRRGYIAVAGGKRTCPRLVANVDERGSEAAYAPSLPLLVGLVDAIIRTGDAARVREAEAMLGTLRMHERPIGAAHLARLALRFDSVAAGRRSACGIRERSVRAGAQLLLVREAIAMKKLDEAHTLTSEIEEHRTGQWARLELARGLFEASRVIDALRMLQQVTDHALMAERLTLLSEIRLVVRRDRVIAPTMFEAYRVAEPLRDWLQPTLDADARRDITLAVSLLRIGSRLFHTVTHRRECLDLAVRAGVDIDAALPELGDDLHAARVEQRAACLRGSMPALRPLADARSLERACFDEQLALQTTSRRRALIGTAQTCLRSALARPDGWDACVIAARLRTLVHLGGARALDAIVKALRTLPIRQATTTRAIEALCCLDASAARDFVLERFGELPELRRLLLLVERHGALPRGFADAFLRERRDKGDAWLARFLSLVGVPSVAVLDGPLAGSPDEVVDRVKASIDGLSRHSHVDVARTLATDRALLDRLLVWQPPHSRPAWSTKRWRAHITKASTTREIDGAIVRRYARILRRPQHVDALLVGDLASLGVTTVTPLVAGGAKYRVRLLDKRRDILAYLRFADLPARSCFHSSGSWYDPADTFTAWKDPLTFCFRIERASGDPRGFLFGSFAEVDGAPAVVMNSLHVRPRSAALREQVVRGVEAALCTPLGITHIGIANEHGGRGPLPAEYVQRDVTLTRHRALLAAKWIPDDISDVVNKRITVTDLLWRTPSASR